MRIRITIVLLLIGLLREPAEAGRRVLLSSGPSPSAQSLAFLARTTGLTPAYRQAYTVLINGMVNAGIWNSLDALYITATSDSGTAKLNLVSSSFPLVSSGTIPFTTNRGFTGDGSTGFLSTGLTPGSGNYAQNSASFGVYLTSNRYTGATYGDIGDSRSGTTAAADIFPFYTDSKTYSETNANSAGLFPAGAATSGFWINARNASGSSISYHNGIIYGTVSQASVGLPNNPFLLGAASVPSTGAAQNFSADRIGAAFIGGGLTAQQVATLSTLVNNFMVSVGANTYGGATGNYSYLYFQAVTGQLGLTVTGTNDGITFSQPLTASAITSGNDVVTPTVLNRNGVLWMASNISNGITTQQLTLDLWTLSLNGLAATHVTGINFSGAIGSGANAAVWSAQWFIDPFDSSVHLFAGASANNLTDTGFVVYETHPTDTVGFTTWSTPVAITGTSLPANLIDPFVVSVGGTYYMFVKDETTKFIDLLSGTSSSGVNNVSWSVLQSGNWAGWGSPLEAPFVFSPDGTSYRILLDAQGAGIFYSNATSWANAIAGTWSAKAGITAPFTPQHGMLIPRPSGYSN